MKITLPNLENLKEVKVITTLAVHGGLIYDIGNGILNNLGECNSIQSTLTGY